MAKEKKGSPKIKSILITQAKPESEKNPYTVLAQKFKLKIDFVPFVNVERLSAKEFRKSRVNPQEYSSVIFTSRNAADHFFSLVEEMRLTISQETKYFCMTEGIALYLQKYIVYRKRKVCYGNGTKEDFMEVLLKHKAEENFFLPCSDIHKKDIADFLEKNKFNFTEAVIYKTLCANLSSLKGLKYDMIAFFSPSGVKSLFQNFPKFRQNNIHVAAFGPTTTQAVLDAGLRLDVHAPVPNALSMSMAIERYLKNGKS